ncbi:MAG: CRISPR-associated protein Csx11, partial [candidate division KSB1 bacterium]|nr:CRISPR-associated protein Csx11 [candidate division KSB1 bacterium]
MNESLDILVQHRDTILLAEVGALLHDLGKLDSRFIIQHSADRPSNFKKYEHERILKDLPALQSLLSNKFFTEKLVELGNVVSELAPSNRKADLSLDRIISKHHDNVSKSPIGYYKLISASTRGVDGVDSGIDKGAVSNKAKQALANTYIATAFGSEEKRIDANALKSLQDKFVKTLNSELNKGITTPSKLVNVRSAIISAAEKAYLQVLGETRRAANDVTLWDHSYSVASLYKAALAKILLDSQWTDPAKLQWRILRISFDGLSFLNNVHRVTDILGRQKAVTNALDNLKKLLELEYPLGNEIYRDENGSAFVVPDISDLLDRVNKNNKSLRGLIEEAFAQSDLKEELKLILSPQAFSEPSRGAILLGKLLAQHVPPLTTDPNVAKGWWDNKVGEVCTVCTLRPMGYDPDNPDGIDEKAKDRHVCHVCLERRGRRSQEWATKGLNATIWIDEAADIYARLALIVGRFHLDNWLNGAFTDTIFTQALAVHGLSYDQLINGLKEALTGKNTGILDIVGGDAWESFKSKKLKSGLSTNKVKSLIEEFYQAIVDDRDVRELSKNVSTLDDRAKLFALFLFRKHPSFARLRRIWETTQDFWVDVAEGRDGQTSLIAEVIEPTGPRLKITATNLQELDLGLYHAYDLLLNGMRFSVVWTPHLNGFITVENLCYIAKQLGAAGQKWEKAEAAASFIKDKLSGDIEIEEPPGYGIKAKKKGTLKGLSTELLKNAQGQPITYTPAIPILTEPRTFMALVPANKALEVGAK